MSGWVFCIGECLSCRKQFTFNPKKVPSFKGEPVCQECMERANKIREEKGLKPHPIMEGAYKEAPEEEVF
jgi:hypothetical protein